MDEEERLNPPERIRHLTIGWKKVKGFDYRAFAVKSLKNFIGTIPVLRICLTFMLIFGLGYPLIFTFVAKGIFPWQADGSLIYNKNNEVIGSALIGQKFESPQFFQGRVSAVDYNGAGSGSSNLAPSNPALIERIHQSLTDWELHNPNVPAASVPLDLVTSSASGLDPHISPEAAEVQIPRISQATGISGSKLREIVAKHIEERELGLFGERKVNVLKLNIELQRL
jgi:potassium-transporting ATPase KdpC subunit